MCKLEWNEDATIDLINLYKENECLWNSKLDVYHHKQKKKDAWDNLAAACKCEVAEVNKKIESLLSSFRRERQKSSTKSGAGTSDTYKSIWFAFKYMEFLLDKFTPRQTNDTLVVMKQYKPMPVNDYVKNILESLTTITSAQYQMITDYKETVRNKLYSTINKKLRSTVLNQLPFDNLKDSAEKKNAMHCYQKVDEKIWEALKHLKNDTLVCQEQGLTHAMFEMQKLAGPYIRGGAIQIRLEHLEYLRYTQDTDKMEDCIYTDLYDIHEKTLELQHDAQQSINKSINSIVDIVKSVDTCVDKGIADFWTQEKVWNQDINTCANQQTSSSTFPPLIHSLPM